MTITFIQSASKEAGTVTTSTLAFGTNVTAGSLKTCLIRSSSTTSVTSASDPQGTYAQDASTVNNTGNITATINSLPNATSGATTVTAAQNQSTNLRFVIQEIGGIATSTPLDQAVGTTGNSTTPASGSVTTLTANEYLCGFICGANAVANAITAGTGWTQDQQITNAADRLMSEYQIVSATGSYNATATIGSADNWTAQIATYKGAAGAASVPFIPIDTDARITIRAPLFDFAPPNLLADQVLKLPPFIQEDLLYKVQWKGVYTDFNPPNLLADQILKLPPFTQAELPGWTVRARGVFTDFAPPTLTLSTLLPTAAPLLPQDLSQQVKARWSATDFAAPNLLSLTLTAAPAPLLPQDLSQAFKARWVGSDYLLPNLLTGLLPSPPVAPVDATISIRAKGVFTDFSPPNLALSTLVPLSPAHPQDISGIRLEYRWIRGDDIPLNLLPLRLATVAPLLPQDLSGSRLDARTAGSDFIPPNLTLFLPVPPPPPPSSGAGRHGTRQQARRRRQLDVLRAKMEAFREQRVEADRALIAAEDGEIKARATILKKIKVSRATELRKPIEQYAPVRRAIEKRTVIAEQHRSILEQIRWHQLEAELIEREIKAEERAREDEDAAVHLMHYLMMESWA